MRTASGIRVYKLNAYAKLNLYLDITGRRDDGYHLLETVMQSISLADEVTVVVSAGNGITLSVSREDIPTDGRNTAFRAAELFLEKAGASGSVCIDIEKRIPSGAGMQRRRCGSPESAEHCVRRAAVRIGAARDRSAGRRGRSVLPYRRD